MEIEETDTLMPEEFFRKKLTIYDKERDGHISKYVLKSKEEN